MRLPWLAVDMPSVGAGTGARDVQVPALGFANAVDAADTASTQPTATANAHDRAQLTPPIADLPFLGR